MTDLLALAERFEKMATIDNSTLKRIERAKELADIVEEFSLVFQKSPDEAKTKYGSRTLKLIAMALTAELDFIREDIRAAMREHGKKASQYTGKRFEKMAGLLGHNPKRDKRDMEDGGDEDQGAAPKHHGLLGHNPTNTDEEENSGIPGGHKGTSEYPSMIRYKCRAECMPDVDRLRRVLFDNGWNGRMRMDVEPTGDVEVEFESQLPLHTLEKLISKIPDGHVMIETLTKASQYTGIRTR